MAKLRGSEKDTIYGIAETLKLALSSSGDEQQLRDYIKSIIGHLEKKSGMEVKTKVDIKNNP